MSGSQIVRETFEGMPGLVEPVIEEGRLRVFCARFEPYAAPGLDHVERLFFFAFESAADWRSPVCVCAVSPYRIGDHGHIVSWIETVEEQRRQGFALELLRAIERLTGWALYVSGVTPEGEALSDAFYAPREEATA